MRANKKDISTALIICSVLSFGLGIISGMIVEFFSTGLVIGSVFIVSIVMITIICKVSMNIIQRS